MISWDVYFVLAVAAQVWGDLYCSRVSCPLVSALTQASSAPQLCPTLTYGPWEHVRGSECWTVQNQEC